MTTVGKAKLSLSKVVRSRSSAFDLANEAKNRSIGEMERVDGLVKNIDDFTGEDKATPEDVQALADQVKV